ncbi:MAG: ABC transporter substrate-binding protein [Chloroflexota bacterium]|nr:ABC transporter substrate-binding protein [Chloroflexota bacterium]
MNLDRRRFLGLIIAAGATSATSLVAACVQTAPSSSTSTTAGGAGVAPTAAPAVATKQQLSEVVVGAAYPLSGAASPAGLDSKAALELAVEMVNTPGPLAGSRLLLSEGKGLPNLGGARVRAVITDHQGDPARGQGEAERLITQEKVAVLFGMYQSAVTLTASQVAERLGVPYFTAESSSPTLSARGFKWFFRSTPHDEHFSRAMFDFLKDLQAKRGAQVRTLGLTYEDTEFGTSSARVQKDLAQKAGYEVKEEIQYRSQSTSLTTEIQRLKAAQPDVWLPTSYVSDAILMVKTSQELDYNPKIVIAQDSGHSDAAFIQQVGRQAEGYTSRAVYSPDLQTKIPALKQLNELFKARTGHDITDVPARVFTGALVLFDALNRAGSVEPERIRQALLATDIKTEQIPLPWKGVKFDPQTGQNEEGTPIIVQLQDAAYNTVWPFEFAAREVVYPIPEWSRRA